MIEIETKSQQKAVDSPDDIDVNLVNYAIGNYTAHKARATMTEEEFNVALRRSVTDNDILDLTDHVVCIATTIKLARSESLHIKSGTIIGQCHSIFSMGTDRGYDNGPPALTLDGVQL